MSNKWLVTKLHGSCTGIVNPEYFGKAEMTVYTKEAGIRIPFTYKSGVVTFEVVEGNADAFSIFPQEGGIVKKINNTTWAIEREEGNTIYDSSKSESYNPLVLGEAGTYRIRFDKYNVAPYSGNEKDSVLLDVKDMIYKEDGVRQKYSPLGNLSINGDIAVLCDFSDSENEYFVINNQYLGGVTTGDLSDITSRLKKLKGITLRACPKMTGNIEIFNNYENKSNLSNLSFSQFAGDLKGDITKAFKGCLSLTSINFDNCGGVTGSIDELGQAQFDNGRTSGNLKLYGYAPNITPNPVSPGKTITFTSSGYTIS